MSATIAILKSCALRYRYHALAVIMPLPFAVYSRMYLIDFKSTDYIVFARWLNFIRHHDWRTLFLEPFNNYAPAYSYILSTVNLLYSGTPKVHIIKYVTFIGDILAATWTAEIVALHYRSRPYSALPVFAFMLTLALPSLIANSAGVGQCDAWWVGFLLAALFHVFAHRPTAALVYAGLAISFKLQAVFLAPFLLICLIKRIIPWQRLWIIPGVYLLICLPAWLEGRPLSDMLTIYWNQYHTFDQLTETGNLYYYLVRTYGKPGEAWHYLPNFPLFRNTAIVMTIAAASIVIYLTCTRHSGKLSAIDSMLLCTLFAVLMPYILPKMINRYFLAADVFSLLLAFVRPRWFMVAVLTQCASLLTYQDWQFPLVATWTGWSYDLRMQMGVWLYAGAIAQLLWLCYRHLWKKNSASCP